MAAGGRRSLTSDPLNSWARPSDWNRRLLNATLFLGLVLGRENREIEARPYFEQAMHLDSYRPLGDGNVCGYKSGLGLFR